MEPPRAPRQPHLWLSRGEEDWASTRGTPRRVTAGLEAGERSGELNSLAMLCSTEPSDRSEEELLADRCDSSGSELEAELKARALMASSSLRLSVLA